MRRLLLAAAIGFALSSMAAEVAPLVPDDQGRACKPGMTPKECGWWYNHNDKEPVEEEEIIVVRHTPAPKEVLDENERCKDPETWTGDCGFVDPGANFEFQSIQRDELMKIMVMHPESPRAVKEFQRYNQWAVRRAVAVMNMWEWNTVQDPSLNPNVAEPASIFGLQMLNRAKSADRSDTADLIRESGGFIVWFTRSDCDFCTDALHLVKSLEQQTGIEVFNASLDDTCYEGFEGEYCVTNAIEAARELAVATVPDLFLHMPEENTWIRLSTGIETTSKIIARMGIFFKAVMAAAENGVSNAEGFSPSVDFQDKTVRQLTRGLGAGVEVNQASGG